MYGDETAPKVTSKPGSFWRGQIEKALARRRDLEPWWDANDRAYAPKDTDTPHRYAGDINTNRDFTLVERKKADLFYQRPEVTLQPSPLLDRPILDPMTQQPMLTPPNPQTGQPGQPIPSSVALTAHQEIVNELLGQDGIDATRMAHQVLFDVLDLSGVGFTCMGYESVTVQTPMAPDPMNPFAPPQMAPVPVYENLFWHHYGPKRAVVPADFRSTEWDKAPFLGYQFELPLTAGNRTQFKLPEDFQGSKSDKRQYFERGGTDDTGQEVFTGTILWYRSCLYREDRPHPEHLTKLVLVDGIDEPTIEEDTPDQTLTPQGDLSPDSLIGFPVHPLNMRTRTDSAWPPADATLTRPLINELNRSREQNLEYRDAMTLKWAYNTDTLPKDALAKIVRAPIGGFIGLPAEAFVGEGSIKELPQGHMPRENFAIADYIDSDISRSWALDAAQQGGQSTSAQTATAEQIQQANANARLDFERGIVLQWYIKGVTKYSTLVQRYLPVARAAQIVGPQRAQIWDVWRKQVASALAFTAMPDSALRVDQAVDRKQAMDFYSFVSPDPYVQKGRQKLLEKLFRKFHVDPDGILAPPDPPRPEPPKLSFSFKGEDLIGPQAVIVLGIAEQLGIKIDPSWVTISQEALKQQVMFAGEADASGTPGQEGDTAHPGRQAPSENLSKHHSDNTGGMQGIGGRPSPMGAGGVM